MIGSSFQIDYVDCLGIVEYIRYCMKKEDEAKQHQGNKSLYIYITPSVC
jgi:hypothetical protein